MDRPTDRAAARSGLATAPESRSARRRPRFTGRALVLILVVGVLAVSYASSMRAYLRQRAAIDDLKAQIAAKRSSIDELEREKARWSDPAYVREMARRRLGYAMPGERSWVVLGADGKPLRDQAAQLDKPSDVLGIDKSPWWDKAWGSVELAGNPPPAEPPPATKITQSTSK